MVERLHCVAWHGMAWHGRRTSPGVWDMHDRAGDRPAYILRHPPGVTKGIYFGAGHLEQLRSGKSELHSLNHDHTTAWGPQSQPPCPMLHAPCPLPPWGWLDPPKLPRHLPEHVQSAARRARAESTAVFLGKLGSSGTAKSAKRLRHPRPASGSARDAASTSASALLTAVSITEKQNLGMTIMEDRASQLQPSTESTHSPSQGSVTCLQSGHPGARGPTVIPSDTTD